MLRRYTFVLNLFLMAAAIFLAERVYSIWSSDTSEQLMSLRVQEARAHSTAKTPTRPRHVPPKAFEAIPEKDLFRPERTEWVNPQQGQQTTGEQAAPTAPAKKMRVYGIVVADDFKQAWLLEEGKPGGKPTTVSEGDTLEDGWKVSAIDSDAVTIARGTETVTYSLVELGNPKPRVVPQTAAIGAPPPGKTRFPAPRPRPVPQPNPRRPQKPRTR